MTAPQHAIRRQTLDVDVSSEAMALAIHPRVSELNRWKLLPAIERVLDELAPQHIRVRIDRLELDLGAIPLRTLESAAEEQLERELRRVLGELVTRPSLQVADSASHRELLEHYLLHGALPFHARGRTFSCEELMLSMLGSDADGLAEVVRRLGRHDYVLERIVAQLAEPALQQLIALLEPRHSALILEYIDDLQEVHRVEPVVPLGERDYARVLWVLVSAYLVRDPGSQFNRKTFVRSLLDGLAASEGLGYLEILAALRVGLEWTRRRQPLRSSLPAVVAELVRELGTELDVPATEDEQPERLSPRDEYVVAELMSIFRRIPSPYRPRPDDRVRGAIVAALLARKDSQPLNAQFYADILAELFAWPLAAPVSRFLRDATEDGDEALREAVAMAARDRPAPKELPRLMAIFNRIPAPYRPNPEARLRGAIVDALLAIDDGAPLTESFYTALLAELFTWPLADVVRRTLLENADEELRAAVLVASRTTAEEERDLRRQASDRRTRESWSSTLSEDELQNVVQALAPHRHRELLAVAEVLASAWRETAPPGHPALTERRAFWTFMLEFLSRGRRHSVDALVAAFFEHSAARYVAVVPVATGLAEEGGRLLARAGELARAGGHNALVGVFHRDRRILLAPWERTRPKPRRTVRPLAQNEAPATEGSPIYIDNAGLVIAAPFLPQLFASMDLFDEQPDRRPVLKSPAAASRAVHLLQHIVDGMTCAPEPLLVLNKILCAVPSGSPVAREVTLADEELQISDKVLRSIVANWTAIKNTSVAGLQETFLQREGKLLRVADGWRLEVQRRTVDILVDELPWNISVICHRWMPEPLYVSW